MTRALSRPTARPIVLYVLQWRAAVRIAFADRVNFALQASGMLINNIVMLSLWWLFFAGFKRIGDWQQADMALLMGITMLVVGVSGVCFGGYRDLAAALLRGDLDALLTQPKALLPRLLARESMAISWGDLLSGSILLSCFAQLQWVSVPWLVLAVCVGTVVFVATAVTFATLAFWMAGARSLARDLVDWIVLFASYPGSIYRGPVRVLAYTLLPAGFVVMLPLQMVRAPSVVSVAMVLGGAALYAGIAVAAFHVGLARYRRGRSPHS